MTSSKTKTASKQSKATRSNGEHFKLDSKVFWIGGTLILLAGSGVAYWYLEKKKKSRKEAHIKTPSSNPAETANNKGFKCINQQYPLTYGTCHPDVSILQRYLKALKMDIGKSGRNRDGIDGQFGALTQAAAKKKLGKERFSTTDLIGIKNALKFIGS
ncbi:MAG: peptidoglycan-binding domain-containing protein [Cytophagales bacterium]|nr:peptidoglycan-binding domain-containing protein [Cytophagales bacterium]